MHHLRSWGPAVAWTSPREALRAGGGALLGLGVTGALTLIAPLAQTPGLVLVAPLGASSVLLFAVPNSPLAQPWSAIVGNTVAALVGVAVTLMIGDPLVRVALAVGLAIVATMLCRAVHPPAGAVAMTAAMNPGMVHDLGFGFALVPVALGTAALVAIAILYARLTGRRYPLRQFDDPGTHGTADPEPSERLGLSEEELSAILDHYRQSFNLGVEDLRRLIAAAEMQAATHRTGPLTAVDVMSRNLVTVRGETPLADVADLFRRHGFTTLPVVGAEDRFLGVIFQIHLIARASDDAFRSRRDFARSLKRLVDMDRTGPVHAADIMDGTGPTAEAATPIDVLLAMMANGGVDAVPVLAQGRIIGIVTRTDLIAAMARATLHQG